MLRHDSRLLSARNYRAAGQSVYTLDTSISMNTKHPHLLDFACLFLGAVLIPVAVQSAQTNLVGPAGSGAFGSTVLVLPNGNIVVSDPSYSEGAASIGAVRLYDANTLSLISTLKGGTANDRIGNTGVKILSNGNFVVLSENWNNTSPLRANAGAATWCSGTTGLTAVVSAANSLIGGTSNCLVGRGGLIALASGNYVVLSPNWDTATIPDAGAATFCNGTTGRAGIVDISNSLIGGSTNDRVGTVSMALANGHYVVASATWNNPTGPVVDAGHATWGSGTAGVAGLVSAANSLIGSRVLDFNGVNIVPLPNGNYVVGLSAWDNPSPVIADVGAAVFCNGATGRAGLVSPANALVGGTANDRVSTTGIRALANGHYVVSSSPWSKPSPAIANVGAVTLCNGNTGTTGLVTSANSLTGNTATDLVGQGSPGITPLPNGDYIVASQWWDSTSPVVANAGAVTLCSGTTGRAGQIVSATNSVLGSTANDWLSRVVALPNGNYVVSSPDWDNSSPAKVDVGVAVWCSGITGRTGAVSLVNALVGSTANDRLSDGGGVVALANGNYVVVCSAWSNPTTLSNAVGAVTFCNGLTGRTGEINSANSLVGTIANSRVGVNGATALANGNYVVASSSWTGNALNSPGAVTWCNGTTGRAGLIDSGNSLVGTSADDNVADDSVVALSDGNYIVVSSVWHNGATAAGAASFGDGAQGTAGAVNSSNSVLGTVAGAFDTFSTFLGYDPARKRFAVARGKQNIVTLFTADVAPRLFIAVQPPNQRLISWTPESPGYVLQERTNLSIGAWSNSPSGSTNPAIVPANSPAKFFRLAKP